MCCLKVSNQSVRFAWDDLHKVKRSPEGADERFSKGIFMKKIFKKGYLYYTPVYPFCQQNHRLFTIILYKKYK